MSVQIETNLSARLLRDENVVLKKDQCPLQARMYIILTVLNAWTCAFALVANSI